MINFDGNTKLNGFNLKRDIYNTKKGGRGRERNVDVLILCVILWASCSSSCSLNILILIHFRKILQNR